MESTKKKSRHLGKYDTPTELGEKWQLDVKYVPAACYSGNDGEFTNFKRTDRVHIFDHFSNKYGIAHKLIRPRTPWHNGKVERSHRNDQERFYNFLKFYSFDDLAVQMKRYIASYQASKLTHMLFRLKFSSFGHHAFKLFLF